MNKKLLLLLVSLVTVAVLLLALLGSNPQSFQRSETPRLPNDVVVPKKENIVFVGDSGTGGEEQQRVADAIADYCAKITNGCAAVVVLGDVIYENGVGSVEDTQFRSKFEDIYSRVGAPFYIAFGNHDYRGCIDCYIDYSQISTKWHMPNRYYRVEFGDNLVVLVVDTENFDIAQQSWLKSELENYAKRPQVEVIVAGHRPVVTSEVSHSGEKWTGWESLHGLLCQYQTPYLSGHAHLLEVIPQVGSCKYTQFISGGGGAALRASSPAVQTSFSASKYGFLVVAKEEGKSAEVTFVGASGESLYVQAL